MFRITFSDQCYLEELRSKVSSRESCFKPAAELGESVRTDRNSRNREALREYLGCGTVDAEAIQDRESLHEDLDAWDIPVSAWPFDLRMLEKEERAEACKDRRLSYQMTWVPAAARDIIRLVKESYGKPFPLSVFVIPDAGRFRVQLHLPGTSASTSSEEDSDEESSEEESEEGISEEISPAAFGQLASEVEKRLHMDVNASMTFGNRLYVRVRHSKRKETCKSA